MNRGHYNACPERGKGVGVWVAVGVGVVLDKNGTLSVLQAFSKTMEIVAARIQILRYFNFFIFILLVV